MSELKANETGVIAVKEMHKKVILEFPYPSERVILDPQTALGVANAISESAYIAETGVHPSNSLKQNVVDIKHKKLSARFAILIGNRGDKSTKMLGKQLADVACSELA